MAEHLYDDTTVDTLAERLRVIEEEKRKAIPSLVEVQTSIEEDQAPIRAQLEQDQSNSLTEAVAALDQLNKISANPWGALWNTLTGDTSYSSHTQRKRLMAAGQTLEAAQTRAKLLDQQKQRELQMVSSQLGLPQIQAMEELTTNELANYNKIIGARTAYFNQQVQMAHRDMDKMDLKVLEDAYAKSDPVVDKIGRGLVENEIIKRKTALQSLLSAQALHSSNKGKLTKDKQEIYNSSVDNFLRNTTNTNLTDLLKGSQQTGSIDIQVPGTNEKIPVAFERIAKISEERRDERNKIGEAYGVLLATNDVWTTQVNSFTNTVQTMDRFGGTLNGIVDDTKKGGLFDRIDINSLPPKARTVYSQMVAQHALANDPNTAPMLRKDLQLQAANKLEKVNTIIQDEFIANQPEHMQSPMRELFTQGKFVSTENAATVLLDDLQASKAPTNTLPMQASMEKFQAELAKYVSGSVGIDTDKAQGMSVTALLEAMNKKKETPTTVISKAIRGMPRSVVTDIYKEWEIELAKNTLNELARTDPSGIWKSFVTDYGGLSPDFLDNQGNFHLGKFGAKFAQVQKSLGEDAGATPLFQTFMSRMKANVQPYMTAQQSAWSPSEFALVKFAMQNAPSQQLLLNMETLPGNIERDTQLYLSGQAAATAQAQAADSLPAAGASPARGSLAAIISEIPRYEERVTTPVGK